MKILTILYQNKYLLKKETRLKQILFWKYIKFFFFWKLKKVNFLWLKKLLHHWCPINHHTQVHKCQLSDFLQTHFHLSWKYLHSETRYLMEWEFCKILSKRQWTQKSKKSKLNYFLFFNYSEIFFQNIYFWMPYLCRTFVIYLEKYIYYCILNPDNRYEIFVNEEIQYESFVSDKYGLKK